MNRNRNAERRRRRRGWGLGGGIPLPSGGGVWEGAVPPSRIFFDFLSGNGAFWCILGACFNVSIRRVRTSMENYS